MIDDEKEDEVVARILDQAIAVLRVRGTREDDPKALAEHYRRQRRT
jgi:hypothetical protein